MRRRAAVTIAVDIPATPPPPLASHHHWQPLAPREEPTKSSRDKALVGKGGISLGWRAVETEEGSLSLLWVAVFLLWGALDLSWRDKAASRRVRVRRWWRAGWWRHRHRRLRLRACPSLRSPLKALRCLLTGGPKSGGFFFLERAGCQYFGQFGSHTPVRSPRIFKYLLKLLYVV